MNEVIGIKSQIQAWATAELPKVRELIARMPDDSLALKWTELTVAAGGYGEESQELARGLVGLKEYPDLKEVVTLYTAPQVMFYFKYNMIEEYQEHGDDYRLLQICNLAFIEQITRSIEGTMVNGVFHSPRIFSNKVGYFIDGYKSYETLLETLKNMTLSTESISKGISEYRNITDRYKMDNSGNQSKDISIGISRLIEIGKNTEIDTDRVESQILKWQTEIANVVTARTWGWEVEAPNPDTKTVVPAGVEAGSDGSVESFEADFDECECDCSSCTYHECDCNSCEDQNDDPEHCRDQEYCSSGNPTEYRTVGGIIRSLHPGLKDLLNQISDSEKNETAGTHIHVYGADLEPQQVAVVLAGYAITQKVWDVIAGRNVEDDRRCKTYSNVIPGDQISVTFKEGKLRHIGKFNAVNTHNVTTERGTLEFRQMNCNFDFGRITLFAWMARGLVEIAKRGAKINEFVGIKDIEDVIKLYAKYGFTTVKETEDIINPVGSRYNQASKRMLTV